MRGCSIPAVFVPSGPLFPAGTLAPGSLDRIDLERDGLPVDMPTILISETTVNSTFIIFPLTVPSPPLPPLPAAPFSIDVRQM